MVGGKFIVGIDFLQFRPSEVAAAAAVAISVAGESETVDTETSISLLIEHVEKVKWVVVQEPNETQ